MSSLPRFFLALFFGGMALPSCGISAEEEDRLEDFRLRATRYFEAQDLNRAEQQARLGLALDPNHGMLNLILGRTLLRWGDLRHVADSRPYLEAAYAADPGFRTSYSLGEFHERYAEFLIGSGHLLEERALDMTENERAAADMKTRAAHQLEGAARHLEKADVFLTEALAENPRNIYALRMAASCAAHRKQDDRAVELATSLCQELGLARDWKNQVLASRGDLSVAEEKNVRRLVREELLMEIEARGLIATLHKKNQRFALAENELDQILKLDPSLSHEHFNRGMCRYWQGNVSGAAQDMQKFLRQTDLAFEADEVNTALDLIAEFEASSASPSED